MTSAPMADARPTLWLRPRKLAMMGLMLALYLASTVPVGLFLYSLKSWVGLDIFREGGFHAYARCLSTSFPLRRLPERFPVSQWIEPPERQAR